MARRSDRRKQHTAARASAPPAAATPAVWWRLALIALVGVIVYSNSLGNPFVFDDKLTVVDNPQIRSFANIFTTDKGSALAGRPVVSLTFGLNYALDGLSVTGYRLVNVGLHMLCGLLLFGVVRRTLEGGPAALAPTRASGLALAVAVLWTVHPLNSEVVDYVTQRTEVLMAVCYLLALYGSVRSLGRQGASGWHTLAVIACAIGMLCKETMVTAPLMIALYDRVFVFESLAAAWRARWKLYAGLAASWIVLAVSVATASREMSGGFATTHVSAWSYLLNQGDVVTHYLTLVVWPQALVAYYGWSLPATLGSTWPTVLFVAALFVASLAALWRWPRLGFLAVWFFVTLAPTSSLFPIAAEVGADRRMYVPLMGLVALAVFAGALVLNRFQRPAPAQGRAGLWRTSIAGVVIVCLASAALGARTVARNRDYESELRLSQTTLEHWPSAVAHDMVGLSLAALNRREEAIQELRQAVEEYAPARYNLGVQLYKLDRVDEAAVELQRFVALEPHLFTTSAAYTLIGNAMDRMKRPAEAIEAYRHAVTGTAPDKQAHGLLADLLADQQQFDEAVTHYRLYLERYPERAEAWLNLGIALAGQQNWPEARRAFERAVQIDPGYTAAREGLARLPR